MKRIVYFIFLISIISNAQIQEIGIGGGSATLISDIGRDDYFIPDGYFGAFVYRSNTNAWLSFLFRFTYSQMEENDALSTSLGRRKRNWRSSMKVYDISLKLEYNFLPLNPYRIPHKIWVTPYLAVGLGAYVSFLTIIPGNNDPDSHAENAAYLPMAFGLKFSFKNRMKIIWEISPGYSFKDNMEGSYMVDSPVFPHSDTRGTDWMIHNGIYITFGWGKLPCYLNMF